MRLGLHRRRLVPGRAVVQGVGPRGWAGPLGPAPALSLLAGWLGAKQKPGAGWLSSAPAGMRFLLHAPFQGLGAAQPHGR